MNIDKKLERLIKLKEDILKESKRWKGDDCPLRKDHYQLSQLFTGLGCWKWDCPFCKEHFEE